MDALFIHPVCNFIRHCVAAYSFSNKKCSPGNGEHGNY